MLLIARHVAVAHLTVGHTRMTWWISLYLGLFLAVAASGLLDAYRDHTSRWFLVAHTLSKIAVAYLFVAFWYPALRPPLAVAAPAFIGALFLAVFDVLHDIRTMPIDPNISESRYRAQGAMTLIVLLLVNGPAFAIAGITAFSP